MLVITVDTRERDLIAIWGVAGAPPMTVVQLDVADVVFRDDDAGIHLLFERKTMTDWVASRKDARYGEQKQRLLAAAPSPACITYILEGDLPERHGLGDEVLSSMSIHTMFRDGIRIVRTASLAETFQWLVSVAERCVKNPAYFAAAASPSGAGTGADAAGGAAAAYLASVQIKTRRAANTTPRSVYLLQLSQLPGISLKTAEAIAGAYSSWPALVGAVATTPAKIKDIPGIGPKRAATLIEYITTGAAPPPDQA